MALLPSQAELLEFYDRHFSLEGPGRRKLSAWVHGNQHPMTTTTAAAVVAKEDGEEAEGGGGNVKDPVEGEHSAAADSGDGCGGDGGRRVRKVVMIEGDDEFKRSMPLLPLGKTPPVRLVDTEQPKP